MFGVFVDYKREIIYVHKVVLQDVYKRALTMFYDKDPLDILRKTIKAILNSNEMKPIGLM